jgi:hypothetical protein
MSTRTRYIGVTLAVASLMGLAPLPAEALTKPGWAGRSWPITSTCFESASGKITNNCTSAVTWIIPLESDVGINGTVHVRAKGNSPSFPTLCRLAVDDGNGGVWAGGFASTQSAGSALTTLQLMNISNPIPDNGQPAPNYIFGSQYVECSVAKSGGAIQGVEWNHFN